MLDQQITRIADDRIKLEIAEQNKKVCEDIQRIMSEMAARGSVHSGATIQMLASLCSEATKDRVQLAWVTLFRFFTTGGVKYYDGLAEELKNIVASYIPESLDDLKGYLKKQIELLGMAGLISEAYRRVEAERITALVRINGEIDLFVISLRGREKILSDKSDQNVFNIYSPVSAIQTGSHAIAYPTQYLDASTQERLLNALKGVEEALAHTDALPGHPKNEIVELVQESQTEIQKEKPNTTKLKASLSTVAESIRTVASLRPAYETLKSLLIYFGINLP